jgi:ssDNA-binding Zn-finger/Zn-ribbon topoisomerase 1
MEKLPNCDVCKQSGRDRPAKYDSKTRFGPHAYLCEEHYQSLGCAPTTHLEERVKIAVAKTDQIPVVHLPLTLDDIVDVKCPHCGETRTVEPDANYTVECESCGNKFRVVSAI